MMVGHCWALMSYICFVPISNIYNLRPIFVFSSLHVPLSVLGAVVCTAFQPKAWPSQLFLRPNANSFDGSPFSRII